TGAALGVAGLLLQTVIRNPLGEPHILGLNAGASLAVVATSALGLSFGAFPAAPGRGQRHHATEQQPRAAGGGQRAPGG
ncbi:iron chelate uptake ABC transporter family permease subunit, partial [Klebsiella pneumoniae]|uniref:iron chelate uptake ABC transporter family permease subunit n=1 Tax=Klebsiella pneumoniae TaxID=573 RepID=UPI0031353D76